MRMVKIGENKTIEDDIYWSAMFQVIDGLSEQDGVIWCHPDDEERIFAALDRIEESEIFEDLTGQLWAEFCNQPEDSECEDEEAAFEAWINERENEIIERMVKKSSEILGCSKFC